MLLPPLIPGRLIRRYKRFLADVRLDDDSVVTVHCPNSGSMRGCLGGGWPVQLSLSDNSKRKYPHTLEMVHNGALLDRDQHPTRQRDRRGGNPGGRRHRIGHFGELRREVSLGEKSRIDFRADRGDLRTWIEVKNVTLVDGKGRYAFPDAVTARGAKHLRELAAAVAAGDRAAMLYLIQRSDGRSFTTADDIDPTYGEELRRAMANGVEVLAYRADVSPEEIRVAERVNIDL